MKFVDLDETGGPENLSLKSGGKPDPAPGQVRIKIAYAGINRPDVMQRLGMYPPPPGASPVLGLEASGWIDAVGENITRWSVGDRVCALLPGGGYATDAVVNADHVLPVPEGLDMTQAGALPETVFTVWTNVFQRAQLKQGERFLVHGGSSGIGTMAIQMAREAGADVYATAGTREKCDACLELGARHAINYKDTDFEKAIKEETGDGVDVILDMVGGDYIAKNVRLLRADGRLVNIAYLNGSKVADFDFLRVMVKRLTVTGSTLRPQSDAAKAKIAQELESEIWPCIANGRIKPLIDKVFDLDDIRDAHSYFDNAGHIGKVVLKVAGDDAP